MENLASDVDASSLASRIRYAAVSMLVEPGDTAAVVAFMEVDSAPSRVESVDTANRDVTRQWVDSAGESAYRPDHTR